MVDREVFTYVFLCKTRSRINILWTALSERKDYSDEIAPELHSSGSIIDPFASLRPNRSSALVRMMNEAVLQAALGSSVIPAYYQLAS